jgi:hypothetical protein
VTDASGLSATDVTTASIAAPPPNASPLIGSIAPNPLTPASVAEFTTTLDGFVSLRLFDVRGRLVARLIEAPRLGAGTHRANVIGPGALGRAVPSGVYFLQLRTEHDGEETRTVTLLR